MDLWGVAFAAIALLFFPPLFGGLGILFGHRARRGGNRTGGAVTMYVSATAMVFGMILGFLLA